MDKLKPLYTDEQLLECAEFFKPKEWATMSPYLRNRYNNQLQNIKWMRENGKLKIVSIIYYGGICISVCSTQLHKRLRFMTYSLVYSNTIVHISLW